MRSAPTQRRAGFTAADVSACCQPEMPTSRIAGGMEPSSVQLAAVFALTSLVGALMFVKGISVHLLERRTVRCRTCGGLHRTGTCPRD